ncbi:helix-turn-helix domain-containing protein [Rhodococcus sp. NBC_00294]|uniref:helix-turn-helix domain-containing protein n=1 Tax=Rhodococcus sp. NBC_00294 TaxID=2976004 RepID=UPI002E2A2F25|nr:helix-turn-helix domain-containing protein [Rhodococcus sp. NBC_00294]
MTAVSDGATAVPSRPLRGLVRRYEGYRLSGFAPGSHVGMPSVDLTIILPIGPPLTISRTAMADQRPGEFGALASGLGTEPVVIEHDGEQRGVQITVTPAGCRALLHVPPAELRQYIVPLEDLLGRDAARLLDGVHAATGWREAFALLDRTLCARLGRAPQPDARLERAWARTTGPTAMSVEQVAAEVGWSRRRLETAFASEYAVTPRDAVRLGRFARAHAMLRVAEPPRLAEVASVCGYFDQAHMARDWRALAGSAPSVWRANEVFASVQDERTSAATGSTA